MPTSLDTNILFLCGQISKRVHEHLTRAFRPYDVTVEQFSVLAFLWYSEGANQQKLAEELERDKTTIARVIKIMEKKQLLIRENDPVDQRNKLLFLTKSGKELQHELISKASEVYGKGLKGMEDHELTSSISLLQKIYGNLN